MVGVLVAVIACTVLGVVIERVAYKPLRGASSPGRSDHGHRCQLSAAERGTADFWFQRTSVHIRCECAELKAGRRRTVHSGVTLVTIITCIVIMVALTTFINKTKVGQAMLAVSEDTGAATLMGINVNSTIAITFAIGSALAAIAGALLCSAYPSLTPYTGSMPGIKAFVAAVFGGIGSIPGALIGGVLLG